jgi:hypothetical protein
MKSGVMVFPIFMLLSINIVCVNTSCYSVNMSASLLAFLVTSTQIAYSSPTCGLLIQHSECELLTLTPAS